MNFKKTLLAATLLVFGLSAFSVPTFAADDEEGGDAEEEVFTIANDTGYTILSLHAAGAGDTDWSPDILGEEDLKDGEEFEIHYTPDEDDADAELYDVKLVWDNPEGEAEGHEDDIWEDLDLKDASKITFHYDAEADETSATVE